MGGIGAGCICLNGYGGLQDFSIRHAPATSALPDRHQPLDAGFALLHLPAAGQSRLVEGPFPPEKIYNLGLKSQGYNGGGFEGLPRFRKCTFRGEYPFGTVSLSDQEIPLAVTITGFNPFIPLDDVNSSLPCAILEYTLRNTSAAPVAYQFSYHLSHLAQKGAEDKARSAPIPGLGVEFWNESALRRPRIWLAALGMLNAAPQIKARWFQGGWFDAISALWREVSQGDLPTDRGSAVRQPPGAQWRLAPGRRRTATWSQRHLSGSDRLAFPQYRRPFLRKPGPVQLHALAPVLCLEMEKRPRRLELRPRSLRRTAPGHANFP